MKIILTLFLLCLSAPLYAAQAPWVGNTVKGYPCQGGGQGYGPFDYIKPDQRSYMPRVEVSHFTPDVENHIKSEGGNTIPGDLDYTLRAIPNHHPALLSIIRYQLKLNQNLLSHPQQLISTPECYLQRAINFSPKDSSSISLYAYYMNQINQLNKAAELYEIALAITPDNTKILYSYGWLLIKLKDFEKAEKIAKQAYNHGNPPDGLKNKLIKLGFWH